MLRNGEEIDMQKLVEAMDKPVSEEPEMTETEAQVFHEMLMMRAMNGGMFDSSAVVEQAAGEQQQEEPAQATQDALNRLMR